MTRGQLPDRRGTAQWFQQGAIYATPTTGAHPLTGRILQAWADQGYEGGPLGYPTSNAYRTSDGGTRVDFEHGSLTLSTSGVVSGGVTPAAEVAGAPAPATTSAATTTAATTPAATTPSTSTPSTSTSSTATSSTATTTSTTATTTPATTSPAPGISP